MPGPKTFTLWIPESSAPLREPEDPQPGPVKMRAAPIGVNLVEDPPNPDAQILWRALKLSDRHKRAVLPERIARTQAGYRELAVGAACWHPKEQRSRLHPWRCPCPITFRWTS